MIRRSLVSFALLIGAATAAPAQTVGGAAPAAQPRIQAQPLGGPIVPGGCLLPRKAMFANAAVGKAGPERPRLRRLSFRGAIS